MKKQILFINMMLAVCSALGQQPIIKENATDGIMISWSGKQRLAGGKAILQNGERPIPVTYEIMNDVAIFSVDPGSEKKSPAEFAGFFFNPLTSSANAVAIWRYKPWNSWTKPVRIKQPAEMPDWDVQFFYWQFSDGSYGAALPLSAAGYRTTIGSRNSRWGSKSISYAPVENNTEIPTMAIAFGKDPYELFERIYRTGLQAIGKGENLRANKTFPEPLNYIGWCTWNSSGNGKNLNEALLVKAAKSFKDNKFPLGWILVDDGWFQTSNGQLRSYQPNPAQFPRGFKEMNAHLKNDYGIKYMGVWHAFDGHWNGIDSTGELGKRFATELFSWQQKESPVTTDPAMKTYYFIKPQSDSLKTFYTNWHSYLKDEGFDFIKVDNQLVTERMAVNNYPIQTLSDSMHRALYASADKYFGGAVINCMDMTPEAYLNFGNSAVARSSEDYFPYRSGETYNLQDGNAAAHVLQGIYNAIYFGQMVYPDMDMFQSHNPNAVFHALARSINCGPVYITDNIGEQQFDVLRPMIFSDGRIIKSQTPLLPAADCLFQIQDPVVFKAFSMVGDKGLLGTWNAADADIVKGNISPSDIHGIAGKDFIVYEYFSKSMRKLRKQQRIPVTLNRMGYALYYVVPLNNGFAALGLSGKYNAPATIVREKWNGKTVQVELFEGGAFEAYCSSKPSEVLVNGKVWNMMSYVNKKLTVNTGLLADPVISITFK